MGVWDAGGGPPSLGWPGEAGARVLSFLHAVYKFLLGPTWCQPNVPGTWDASVNKKGKYPHPCIVYILAGEDKQ